MVVTYSDIDNQIKRNLFYFKHQRDIIKAHETRAAMVSLKNKWRMNQKIKNYQDEYMRLRGALSTSTIAMKGKPTSEIIREHEHTLIPKLGLQMISGLRNRNEFLEKQGTSPIYKIN